MIDPQSQQKTREEKGLSEELAGQSGVDAGIIRAIERDRWYQESEGFLSNLEEGEVLRRLTATLGAEETRILIDMPPRLQPRDIVLARRLWDSSHRR